MVAIGQIYARTRKLATLFVACELSAGTNRGIKKKKKKKERTERKRHRWEVEREVVGKEAFLRCEDQEEKEKGRKADKNEEGKVSKFCGRTRTSGGIKRKKADQESCEDPIIGGYCGIITLAAAPVPACRSPEGLLPSPRSHSKPLGRPAFCR